MSRMFQTLPMLLGGVSQKPDTEMAANEVKRMDNCLLSRTDGVRMRPPTQHMGVVDPDISDMPDSPFVHTVKRAAADIYSIIVFNGELFIYNSLTGEQKPVLTPNGMAYLASATGFRATTIGDVTVLVNRDKTVEKLAQRAEPTVNEALVYVKNAQYSNTYKMDFGSGYVVTYTTAALDDTNANKTLATEDVAIGIYAALTTNSFFNLYFSATFFGSSVLVSRKNGADFSLQVTDSLAGQGLILIKNTVQRFEDLPPRAREGMVVKVSGDPLSVKDDYWVKYEEVDELGQDVGGVWREVPAPGSSSGLDATTMPWAITRVGSPIGRRRVLKDPLAPEITHVAAKTVIKGFNITAGVEDRTTGVLLTDDGQETPIITLTADDLFATHGGVAYVCFDVDNFEAARDDSVVVELFKMSLDDGDVTFNICDEVAIFGGERKWNLTLRTTITNWEAGDQFKVRIQTSGTAPKPRVFVHAAQHPEYPGFKLMHRDRWLVQYPLDAWYTEGHTERLRIAFFSPSGNLAGYYITPFYTCTPGETISGMDMAVNMALEVDYQSDASMGFAVYTSEGPENGSFYIDCDVNMDLSPWFGSMPYDERSLQGGNFFVMREFQNNQDVCYIDTPTEGGYASDTFAGMTVRNVTDGSTGVIDTNFVNMLRVTGLSGGARNSFEPGDILEIVGEEDEYFLFDRIDWTPRLAGSDDSAPLPSFVGKRISEVFFYKNRLGFCCGESVVTSASGDLFRFFRRTATDILDDDPIDVTSAHQSVAAFGAAVNWKERLVLFSDSGHQFVFEGDPTLTPKTAAIRHVGSHPCTLHVRPMTVGDQLFFTRATSGYTRVLEMYLDGDGKAQTRDLTKNVPQYIAGSIVEMTGDSNVGSLFFLTNSSNLQDTVFVWTYDKGEDGSLLMGAWHKWTFGPTSGDTTNTKPRIFTLGMVDGSLYMVVVRKGHPVYGQEGVMLERINLTDPTDTNISHWDRYNIPNIAAPYSLLVILPTVYPRDDNGKAITDGTLKLTYMNLNYHRVGLIRLRGSTLAATQFEVNRFFGGSPGVSGKLRLPVMAKNTGATIDIACEHWLGCGFTTISWEGDYHHSRR
jgi:hypothetical protein